MATFNELLQDVYTLTKRPDLEADTILAVKAATLKAHQSDYYPKDIRERAIVFSESLYLQSLEYLTVLPRFRALKYARKYHSCYADIDPWNDGYAGSFLKVIDPTEALDSYRVNKSDVIYLAGSVLQIRSAGPLSHLLMGYYENPTITPDNYSSWIAVDHPYLIVYEAAITVFKTIGYDEQAAVYQRLVIDQLSELRMSNISAEGY